MVPQTLQSLQTNMSHEGKHLAAKFNNHFFSVAECLAKPQSDDVYDSECLPQFMPLASVHAARLTKIKACFEDLQCVCGHGYQPCARGQGSGGRDGKACEKPHSARPLDRNVQIGLTPQRTQAAQGRAYEYKNDINGDTRQLKRPLAVTASSPPVAYFTVRVPPFQSGSNERTE